MQVSLRAADCDSRSSAAASAHPTHIKPAFQPPRLLRSCLHEPDLTAIFGIYEYN